MQVMEKGDSIWESQHQLNDLMCLLYSPGSILEIYSNYKDKILVIYQPKGVSEKI